MTCRSSRILARLFLAAFVLLFGSSIAEAHKPSDSYLTLVVSGDTVDVRWDIALRDLDTELALDTDDDGALSWREVRSREADIRSFAFAHLGVRSAGSACALGASPPEEGLRLAHHSDGTYAVLAQHLTCPALVHELDVEYRLFASTDPSHRGIVRLSTGMEEQTAVMGPDNPSRQFQVGGGTWQETLHDFVKEGIWHIWLGFDHILFLLALLLPSVLSRTVPDAKGETRSFRTTLIDVVRIVTAFTVAHSITLTLAVLGWVSLPSRLVESAIALTVVLAAANNVWPIMKERRWVAAFGFGLIHGFGFASALKDLGLPPGALALSLFGFNLGVEIGQLAVVSVFFPMAYLMRATTFYRRWVVGLGSCGIVLLAGVWLLERVFDFKVLPV
jgi:hypothetical protein